MKSASSDNHPSHAQDSEARPHTRTVDGGPQRPRIRSDQKFASSTGLGHIVTI